MIPPVDDAAAILLEVEEPEAGAAIHAGDAVVGYGWVLAASPVLGISVALDGQPVCEAKTGLARTDVADLYPDHPGNDRPGFTFVARMSRRPSGPAVFRLLVRTADAELEHLVLVEVIGEGGVAFVAPMPAVAVPANIEAGLRVELEEARVDAGGRLHVRGWAVSLSEIQAVEVFAGGRSLGFADTGLSRADVATALPAFAHAGLAGFALSVPAPDGGCDDIQVVAADAAGATVLSRRAVVVAPQAAAAELPPMHLALEEARINELGILRIRGWIASLSPVEHVQVEVDGEPLGAPALNLPREDVGQAYPGYPNAGHGGFLLQRDVADERLAGSTVRVAVTALGGIVREASSVVTVAPVVRRRDRAAADIQVRCDAVTLTEDGALLVSGWAVCPTGLAEIEISLGDEALGAAELGLDRADVGNHYPNMPGSRTAGFRFVGRAGGRQRGEQVVRLAVRGQGGETRMLAQPVLAQPETVAPEPVGERPGLGRDGGIRFYLDSPAIKDGRAVEPVHGFLPLHGWAFSASGISGIEVFVDGRSQGQAYRGIRREDLLSTFARREALRSGFAMLVPPQVLKPGRHDLRVVIRDGAGHAEELAFAVDAEPSMERPGPWWLRQRITQAEADLHGATLAAAGFRPAWTVLLPGAAGAPLKRVRATLETLRLQAYPDWQLVAPVATDGERRALLAALQGDEAGRVRVVTAPPDTAATDLVPPGTQPALVTLLAPGDLLGEDALLEMAIAAAEPARPEFIYSDERRVDPSDGEVRAFFKPDWSPDLLLSTNYVGRLWVATPELLGRAGVLLGDPDRHGEYDLTLRLTEAARGIAHVPRVLCARGAKLLDTPASERRALSRALARRRIEAEIVPGCLPGTWRIKRRVAGTALVSIIIPTIARRGLVRTAIASIRQYSAGRAIEIICLDNIAAPETDEAASCKAWLREAADVVVEVAEKFNWSRFNNIGARAARGDVLLFLNDDIEVTHEGWLDGLLEQALRPEVGAVGPQLLYPEGRVQHAGMFLSHQVGRHAFRLSPRDAPGPFGLALTQRDVIAVTGACMMVRRDVFEALGGFDEAHAIINNDLDFCLRLRTRGLAVIYTPHVSLTHHEMVSRGEFKDDFHAARFDRAWKHCFLAGDPFFNPNLSLDYDDYAPDEEPVRVVTVGHPVIAREQVRRILAVKVDHIGDFVTAFPALRRLKQRFPAAELTVLAASGSLALAKLEPAIDHVIAFDFFQARSERGRKPVTRKDLARLQEELAPYRFDLAVDLRRQPETRQLLQHSGARWLAGFDQQNRTRWLDIAVEWEGDVARTHKRTHIGDALVQFVEAVAVACETDRQGIDAASVSGTIRAALPPLPSGRYLVCVHPGAGAENKQWPVASFAALIALLTARHDVGVVVIGGADEAAMAEQLAAGAGDASRAVSLAGRLNLPELPTLLLACDLYVGNDSGPKHMAAALGVPTVGIHSGTVDATEWGPMGPRAVGIRREMTCSPCYLAKASDCHRGLACLTGINVADVYRVCRRMLALRGAADAPPSRMAEPVAIP